MEDNLLVGPIPEELYSDLALEKVILKSNALTSTISELVGDLTKLTTFWTSFNELTGTIPTGFGNLLSLEELELQKNLEFLLLSRLLELAQSKMLLPQHLTDAIGFSSICGKIAKEAWRWSSAHNALV